MERSGIVFHIQRFSIHDGPGIRTTVFLKGCSLRCFWCHNPEGRRPRPEIRYSAERCLTCGACVDACPNHAHAITGGIHTFDRDACRMAGECVEVCFSGALELNGRSMTAEEVIVEVSRDRAFYRNSGGGVTLSGGEPSSFRGVLATDPRSSARPGRSTPPSRPAATLPGRSSKTSCRSPISS